MLSELIARPSASSKNLALDQSNRDAIALLAQWLEDLGFRIEIIPSQGLAHKFNLIAAYGEGKGGLIFSGHSDTVPCDETQWIGNPYELREENDRWHGLGATDMKGFFPTVIEAIRSVGLNRLKKPLIVVATADEESSMSGILTLKALDKPKADYVIIGEPTRLKPIRMNKGILMESLQIRGVAGHSSNPEKGKNAIDGMFQVMNELIQWRLALKDAYQDTAFEISYPTLNFGKIIGGDSPNRICPACELQIDIRLLPGLDLSAVRAEVKEKAETALRHSGLSFKMESLFPGTPAMETPENSPLVVEIEKLTHLKAGAVQFATEGNYFNAMGMDTVVIGPGDIDLAHQPNEFIEIQKIHEGVTIYANLIKKLCF
jgi:acetylornithine deacetylase